MSETMRERCRYCERSIAVNPVTGYLRFHKISSTKSAEIGFPLLDGGCPGAGAGGR